MLFWFNLIALPNSPVTPQLDLSWCGALIYFAARGLQYGTDVIFTYGPLGHLTSFVYTGELFGWRVLWEFVSKTAFAAVLAAAVMRLPRVWRFPFAGFVLLFIWADPIADALHFLVLVSLGVALLTGGTDRPLLNVVAGPLFAICALIKFTYLVLIVVIIACVIARYFHRGRAVPAAILAGTSAVGFMLAWRIPGQHFTTLPAYLRMSWQIAAGYKEAMGVPAGSDAILYLGFGAVFLALLTCLIVFLQERTWHRAFLSGLIAFAVYLSWSRGFVRADDHVLSFFALCPPLVLIIWTAVKSDGRERQIGYGLTAAVLACCLGGIWAQKPAVVTGAIADTVNRFRGSWRVLTDTGGVTRELAEQLRITSGSYALPRVVADVGTSSIDAIGYEQGILLLNHLNYRPRFVFQSYSAYTRPLIEANSAFFRSPAAPAYVLLKLAAIDNRYPTIEDADVLRQLLYDYDYQFEENGYLLWKRRNNAYGSVTATAEMQQTRIGAEVALPRAPALWLEIDVRASRRGKLRTALYKPAEIQIRTVDEHGTMAWHRLIPSMSTSGFLISPLLSNTAELASVAGGGKRNAVVSFSVRVRKPDRRFFQPEYSYRVTPLPEFSQSAAAENLPGAQLPTENQREAK